MEKKKCPINFDTLEWKENPYGKTTKIYSEKHGEDEEPSYIEIMYYPTVSLWCADCVLIKKALNGSVYTYDVKIKDKEGTVLLRFAKMMEDLRE